MVFLMVQQSALLMVQHHRFSLYRKLLWGITCLSVISPGLKVLSDYSIMKFVGVGFFFLQFQPSFLNKHIHIIIIFLTRIKSRSCYSFPDFPILLCGNHCLLATFTHYKLRSSCKLGKIFSYCLDSQIFPLLFECVTEPQKPVYLSCTPRKMFKITRVNGRATSH